MCITWCTCFHKQGLFWRELFPIRAAYLKILLISLGMCVFVFADYQKFAPPAIYFHYHSFCCHICRSVCCYTHSLGTETLGYCKSKSSLHWYMFQMNVRFLVLSCFVWDVHKCLGILYIRPGGKITCLCYASRSQIWDFCREQACKTVA